MRLYAAFSLLVLAGLACTCAVPVKTVGNPSRTETPLPTLPYEVLAMSQFITVGNVYIRESPDGIIVGSLPVGEMEMGACVGKWCELESGGFVWRGCTDDNPELLGCAAK